MKRKHMQGVVMKTNSIYLKHKQIINQICDSNLNVMSCFLKAVGFDPDWAEATKLNLFFQTKQLKKQKM